MQTWDFAIHLCPSLDYSYFCVRLTSKNLDFSFSKLFKNQIKLFGFRICELAGVYREGEFRGDAAYPYMIAANNLSQFVAMYCLVFFYRAHREALNPMKPIGKFLCIKAVVFFSFL